MKSLGKEQQFFQDFDNESAKASNAGFRISRETAASGKNFSNGESVKKCMLLAVSELCPEKMRMFQNISLSRVTVQRVADIAANLTDQLKQKVKEFCFYLLAMDDTINCCDTAQLVIYIRCVVKDLVLVKNLLPCNQ